jgi:hypothetical protein
MDCPAAEAQEHARLPNEKAAAGMSQRRLSLRHRDRPEGHDQQRTRPPEGS